MFVGDLNNRIKDLVVSNWYIGFVRQHMLYYKLTECPSLFFAISYVHIFYHSLSSFEYFQSVTLILQKMYRNTANMLLRTALW